MRRYGTRDDSVVNSEQTKWIANETTPDPRTILNVITCWLLVSIHHTGNTAACIVAAHEHEPFPRTTSVHPSDISCMPPCSGEHIHFRFSVNLRIERFSQLGVTVLEIDKSAEKFASRVRQLRLSGTQGRPKLSPPDGRRNLSTPPPVNS